MPTSIEYNKERGKIFTVLADGKFHTSVPENSEGAIRREYETSDGKKGVKFEQIANSVSGLITNVGIYEGDYGKQLQITLGDNEILVCLSCQSPFGEDFLKKAAKIEPDKEVKLVPFAFEDDKGKKRRGLTIYQNETKVADNYHVKTEDRIVATNGYPTIPEEAKDWDSEDWKLYFGQARKFLLEELKKSPLFNRQSKTDSMKPALSGNNYPQEDIKPEDIPFR